MAISESKNVTNHGHDCGRPSVVEAGGKPRVWLWEDFGKPFVEDRREPAGYESVTALKWETLRSYIAKILFENISTFSGALPASVSNVRRSVYFNLNQHFSRICKIEARLTFGCMPFREYNFSNMSRSGLMPSTHSIVPDSSLRGVTPYVLIFS